MTKSNTLADKLFARVEEGKAKFEAAGGKLPDGTYTFTNKEASVVSASLGIVSVLLDGDVQGAFLMLTALNSAGGREASEIASRIAKELLDKQCPAYISDAVDTTWPRSIKPERTFHESVDCT